MTISARTQLFLDRIRDHALSPAMRSVISECLAASENFVAMQRALERDGTLTARGQAVALDAELPKVLKAFVRATDPIKHAQSEIATRRAAMVIKQPDQANVSAAIERGEIRAYLRGLNPIDWHSLVETTEDPRILEAMVTAPPVLSGFTADQAPLVDAVKERYLQLNFGAEMSALDESAAVIAEASAAAQVARNEIQKASGLSDRDFAATMAPIEKKIGAPWLLKQPNGDVLVVKPGQNQYPVATADDLRDGVFYKDEAEWRAAQGAPSGTAMH
jgi:hypothetical protein